MVPRVHVLIMKISLSPCAPKDQSPLLPSFQCGSQQPIAYLLVLSSSLQVVWSPRSTNQDRLHSSHCTVSLLCSTPHRQTMPCPCASMVAAGPDHVSTMSSNGPKLAPSSTAGCQDSLSPYSMTRHPVVNIACVWLEG